MQIQGEQFPPKMKDSWIFFVHILYDVCIYIYTYHIIFVLNLRILLFVYFCSGPATDDKHFRDCLFVVSTINLLSPGRNERKKIDEHELYVTCTL